MSTEIVKKNKDATTFGSIERVASQVGASFVALDPALPIPSDFNAAWGAREIAFMKAVESNEGQALVSTARAVGKSSRVAALQAWLTVRKASLVSLSFAAVAIGGGIFLGVTGDWGFAMSVYEKVLAGGAGGVGIAMPVSVPLIFAREMYNQEFHPAIRKAFDAGYQLKVTEWAQGRYGVAMIDRWASSKSRLADDIAYVGDKDGQKIYCQERPEGWVLTYNDGTELPVLVEQKELVEA